MKVASLPCSLPSLAVQYAKVQMIPKFSVCFQGRSNLTKFQHNARLLIGRVSTRNSISASQSTSQKGATTASDAGNEQLLRRDLGSAQVGAVGGTDDDRCRTGGLPEAPFTT